jgi:RND family efflux transporter MFP subunit
MNSPLPSQSRGQKAFWFMVSIGILALGIVGFILLRALKPVPEQRDPVELIPLGQVSPLVFRDTPLIVEGNGMVMPTAAISVSAQVSGEVVGLPPNLVSGGAFNEGEIIVQIDPRTYEANLKEAEAAQKANQATLDFVSKQITRIESLVDDQYVGQETLDDAISRRDQTLAAIARQEAVIENRKLDLERTSIRAPFTGRVYDESVDLGDIVSPGKELARFYASDEVEVVTALNVDESVFIPGLWAHGPDTKQHRRAWVQVNHGGHYYAWEGYVHRVESDIDRTTRTVDVVVRVPEPFRPGSLIGELETPLSLEPPPLLVGMYADVGIEGMRLDKHFVLPINALRPENTIWIATPEGTLQVIPVEFIRQEGNQAVLLAPALEEGTPIVISDIALVTDGMRIQVETVSGAIN